MIVLSVTLLVDTFPFKTVNQFLQKKAGRIIPGAPGGNTQIWRKIAQRDKNKGPFRQTRVRQKEFRPGPLFIVEQKQIQINDPWTKTKRCIITPTPQARFALMEQCQHPFGAHVGGA